MMLAKTVANPTFTAIIAEDHLAQTEMLISLAEGCGIAVVDTVSTGAKLIQSYVRYVPDIIITDIGLKQSSGLDACRELKHQGYDPFIIVVTGIMDVRMAEQSFELDSLSYLVKPVTEERFKKSIQKVMERMDNRLRLSSPYLSNGQLLTCRQKIYDVDGSVIFRDIHLNEEHIVYITKDGKETTITLMYNNVGHMIRSTSSLKQLNELSTEHIFQANKSQLVNVKFIQQVCADLVTYGNYEIILHGVQETVTLSRNCVVYFERASTIIK
ncbi:LytR/AlgR family response regulator transcription factor [Paenibacillus arenosi]|uniref:Response regulator transcription factor n=1 Tax=Paenibacillus arenosi TaxID=2774142 RepID=A0ABR9ART5_9BACL|nr:response regulator transcription factor [Paenibacillus arenosi]MBD8496816.1 response regulator transcription factor [Paenibacillus arenosi]